MSTKVQRGSAAAREARIKREVDEILAAIAKPTPTEAFQALLAEHGIQLEEWDASRLPEELRDSFHAFYLQTKQRKVIVVLAGQDPAERLAAVRVLLTHQGVIA